MDVSNAPEATKEGEAKFGDLPPSREDEVLPSPWSPLYEDHLVDDRCISAIHGEALGDIDWLDAQPWQLIKPASIPSTPVPTTNSTGLLKLSVHSPFDMAHGPPRVFQVRSAPAPYELQLSTPGRLEDIIGVCKLGLKEIGRSNVGYIVKWRKELSHIF